ncbi:max-binding protein MNT [Harmonia axyridis]|uniref:max-binding protein MNT n=1 Tax=Harmonia axyridis TaxID=115357 RepID=UPI001E27655A|nr:max-binding protein MNT [Harmonia axyridis]XP_045466950.1 max-binding protein MNT [Harmonia axyridis]
MSLNTLWEAAKFLEMQERKEKRTLATIDAALSATTVVATTTKTHNNSVIQSNSLSINQQALVIATSHLPGATHSVIQTPVPSTTPPDIGPEKKMDVNRRFIQNSFDIINPLYIDEKSNVAKRKPPPLVFRAGTREVHNKLEKHRRAHLKECFDILKKQLPASPDEKKSSNLNILHSAIRYIQVLRKREMDLEQEMERLAREKISWQSKLTQLKKDLSSHYENVDFNRLLADVVPTTPEDNHRDSSEHGSSIFDMRDEDSRSDYMDDQPHPQVTNGVKKLSLPILPSKSQGTVASTLASLKDVQQPVQTALSVLPVGYPLNQGLVLQKLAIVPKGITDLSPLVPTFITQQQLNGKVVPLVNAQYVVGKCPLVVVSTANPRPS